MTIPVWVATVLIISLVSTVGFFIRLVLDHDRRITRLENHQPKEPQ